jgi:uncharacterized protein YacL
MIEASYKGGVLPEMISKIIRFFITIIGAIIGLEIVGYFLPVFTTLVDWELAETMSMGVRGLGVLVGAFIGFVITPSLKKLWFHISGWVEAFLQKTPVQDLVFGAIGLIIGLIIANLLSAPFYRIKILGVVLPIFSSLVLGYLGMVVAVKKRNDLPNLFAGFPRLMERGSGASKDKVKLEAKAQCKILDTSVIIDGRIADIYESGFLEGTLVIPGFVLEELRHIADSSDLLKRNRGRRGLDILNQIQKQSSARVQIYEKDFDDIVEVDSNLALIDPLSGTVLDAGKRIIPGQSRHRELIPNIPYSPPPAQDKTDPLIVETEDAFIRILDGEENKDLKLDRFLADTFLNISRFSAKEIVKRAGLDENTTWKTTTYPERSRLWNIFEQTINPKYWEPHLILKPDKMGYEEFIPVRPTGFKPELLLSFFSVNKMLDFYFTQSAKQRRLQSHKSQLVKGINQTLKRYHKKIALQENEFIQAENAEYLRIEGELLLANLHQLRGGRKGNRGN